MKTGTFTGDFENVLSIVQNYDVILERRAGLPIIIPKDEAGYNMCLLLLIECRNIFNIPTYLYSTYDSALLFRIQSAHKHRRIKRLK